MTRLIVDEIAGRAIGNVMAPGGSETLEKVIGAVGGAVGDVQPERKNARSK